MSGGSEPRSSARRAWIAAWLGLPLLGIANGAIRERTLRARMGDDVAHQVSTGTLVAGIAAYAWGLERRWPLERAADAASVGGVWTAMTVTFEFVFGHFVAKESWRDLARDYDLRRGRLWVFVPITTALVPAAVRALRARRRWRARGTVSRRIPQ
jgi:hypothetical protein